MNCLSQIWFDLCLHICFIFLSPTAHSHLTVLWLITKWYSLLLLFSQSYFFFVQAVIMFSSYLFYLTCAFALPPHWACVFVFVFTERPKECVWWSDIGCIGAPRAQEETQMCAAMRGSYLFNAHTHTHIHIRHTYIHLKYIHTHPHPFPLLC